MVSKRDLLSFLAFSCRSCLGWSSRQTCSVCNIHETNLVCHCTISSTCLSIICYSEPGESSVQITLLAVRRRYRRLGIGRYLMQHCKDPSIVGQYDKLLAYADHKAESFFLAHGFSDDPLLTAVLRCTQANLLQCLFNFLLRKKADYWENSTLMVYIPPFSGKNFNRHWQNCLSARTQTVPSTGVGTIKSFSSLDEHMTRWWGLMFVDIADLHSLLLLWAVEHLLYKTIQSKLVY